MARAITVAAMPIFDQPSPNRPVVRIITPQKRKRSPKAAIACESCRKLKSKCDQKHPCCVCARNNIECVYRDKRLSTSKTVSHSRQLSKGEAPSETEAGKGSTQLAQRSTGKLKGRRASILCDEARSTHSNRVAGDKGFIPIAARPLASSYSNNDTQSSQNQDTVDEKENKSGVAPSDPSDEDEPSPHGFGEVNKYTSGTEFYGPTATLAFLIELRSRARSFQTKSSHVSDKASAKESNLRRSGRLSIVNFFHGDDNVASGAELEQNFAYDENRVHGLSLASSESSPASSHSSHQMVPNFDIEKECIQLYFANLHLIYYFLDKASFIARCENEIWSGEQQPAGSRSRRNSKFPALYNAVIAVGAITAGDDTAVAQSRDKVQGFMDDHSKKLSGSSRKRKPIYPPLELAQVYFAKAKSLLSDMFEASSLESTQTLILMSIFCQYALKPHECYMYSGMAARTALAMGSANEPDIRKNPIEAIRTWWCLYYHEIEVCCSLGRETFLREPNYYPVYFAKFPDPMPSRYAVNDNTLFFARANTELAYILKRTFEEIYHPGSKKPQGDKYQAALRLDESLLLWKSQLSSVFDFKNASLTEPETVSKRKVVLKLRFYSVRILIHRPFLVAAAYLGSSSSFVFNIKHCLDASQETIDLLYETFVNRPFFRTWWYNTTYAFNAITIILYAVVSHLQKGNSPELLNAVEKSLKIFQAMDGIAVARRCADLTQEIFEVAKMSVEAQQLQQQEQRQQQQRRGSERGKNQASNTSSSLLPYSIVGGEASVKNSTMISGIGGGSNDDMSDIPMPQPNLPPQQDGGGIWAGTNAFDLDATAAALEEDFFASLIDPKILDSFGANMMGGGGGDLLMDQSFFEGLDFGQGFGV